MDNYHEMYWKFQQKIISEEAWVEYCNTLLLKLLGDNKDVFERLKKR